MKYNLKQELPLLAIVIAPFIYLGYIWNSLPVKVPIHWNFKGEIDGWGGKEQLFIVLFALPVLVYVLFQIIPAIDPKKKVEKMGNKFFHLKLFMVLFMSILTILILYSVQNQSVSNIKFVYVLLGFLIVGLGNYFPTLKPNYFIGIKTPWTLENETVWKETHKMSGKLWFVGGILMTICALLLPAEMAYIIFISGAVLLAVVPILFSYIRYKAIK